MQININPDKDFVAHMRKALKDNNGFCPCAIVRSEDTKCMCKEFREMEEGTCHCGLYIKIKDTSRLRISPPLKMQTTVFAVVQ